jgi:cellulose synthase (UDP-forming)
MQSSFRLQLAKLRWYILMLIITMGIWLSTLSQPSQALLGAYDPAHLFQDPSVVLEHHFVTWRPDNASELVTALQQTRTNHRIPMITLEPWPWNSHGMDRSTLLPDILAGRYDRTIDRVLHTLQAVTPQQVVIRWAHEMEIVGQYPWSVQDAKSYIAAYRYIHQRSRQLGVNNLVWLWSPAGNKNAVNYWPGGDVVDWVGISIYATPEWDPDRSGKLPSFQRLMQEKYHLVKQWRKPVIVAEVGVNATPPEKQRWLSQAIHQLSQFPQLIGWVYFNQIQPEIVPLPIGQPNWSLQSEQVDYLVKNWPRDRTNASFSKLTPFPLNK